MQCGVQGVSISPVWPSSSSRLFDLRVGPKGVSAAAPHAVPAAPCLQLTTARHAQLEAQEAASVAEAASGPTTGKPPAGHNRSGPQASQGGYADRMHGMVCKQGQWQ